MPPLPETPRRQVPNDYRGGLEALPPLPQGGPQTPRLVSIVNSFARGRSTGSIAQEMGLNLRAVNNAIRSLYGASRLAASHPAAWSQAVGQISTTLNTEASVSVPLPQLIPHTVTRHDVQHWQNYREVQQRRYGVRNSREMGLGALLHDTLHRGAETAYVRNQPRGGMTLVQTGQERWRVSGVHEGSRQNTAPVPRPPARTRTRTRGRNDTLAQEEARVAMNAPAHVDTVPPSAPAPVPVPVPAPTPPAPEPLPESLTPRERLQRATDLVLAQIRTEVGNRPEATPSVSPPRPPTVAPTPFRTTRRRGPVPPSSPSVPLPLNSEALGRDAEYREQLYDTLKGQLWTAYEFEREYNGTTLRNETAVQNRLAELLRTQVVGYGQSHSLSESYYRDVQNPYNVSFITHDSSVRGSSGFGAEINVVGTNESMMGLLPRYKAIFDILDANDLDAGPTTATHCHARMLQQTVLPQEIAMGTVELVRVMMPLLLSASATSGWGAEDNPGILRQGVTRYANPTWVIDNMGTDGFDSYTAWTNAVKSRARRLPSPGPSDILHYIGFNILQHTLPTADGKHTQGLHVEYRFGDGTDLPAQAAALSELYRAIILRAAEYYRDTGQQYRADPRLIQLSRALTENLLADKHAYTGEVAEDMRLLLGELSGQMTPTAFNVLKSLLAQPPFLSDMRNARKRSQYEEELETVTRDSAEARRSFIRQFLDLKTIHATSETDYYDKMKQRMLEHGAVESDVPTADELKNLGFRWDSNTHHIVYAPRLGIPCPSCRLNPPAPIPMTVRGADAA